jgi:hypothetical protein
MQLETRYIREHFGKTGYRYHDDCGYGEPDGIEIEIHKLYQRKYNKQGKPKPRRK